jgi:serine/threonine protein kinase
MMAASTVLAGSSAAAAAAAAAIVVHALHSALQRLCRNCIAYVMCSTACSLPLLLLLLQVWHRQGWRRGPGQAQVQRQQRCQLRQSSVLRGTPAYMAREYFQKGDCGTFTDVYAFGETRT